MKKTRSYIMLFVLLLFTSIGIALTIKASIGLGAFDAINQTFSYLLNIKIGRIMSFIQIIFVIIQLLILKKEAKLNTILQIPMSIIFGELINFFYYYIFGEMNFNNYLLKFSFYIFGMIWIAFFMSGIMTLNIISIPIESLPMVISVEINRSYGQIRQYFDFIFIVVSLLVTYIFSLPLTIREGTVIGALIFGPLLNLFMPIMEKNLRKYNFI